MSQRPSSVAEYFLRNSGVVHLDRSPCVSEPIPMRKLPTGEPCAGEPHARFGGRGRLSRSRRLSGDTGTGPAITTFGGDAVEEGFQLNDVMLWCALCLFLHADLPKESLLVQCFHQTQIDGLIRVGFFRLRILA